MVHELDDKERASPYGARIGNFPSRNNIAGVSMSPCGVGKPVLAKGTVLKRLSYVPR